MHEREFLLSDRLSLAEAVDHLLAKGAVLTGDATLSLAGVDLVYVGLNVLVASVETLRGAANAEADGSSLPAGRPKLPAPFLEGQGERRPTDVAQGLSLPFKEGGRELRSDRALPASGGDLYADPEMRSAGPASDGLAWPHEHEPQGEFDSSDARPEQGLARLVLTLIELLRQVLERQALRRVDSGGLSEEQIERMGITLMDLDEKMREMRTAFGLKEEDLILDLGPLGRLQ
jgi:hypothetical protein